MITISTFYNYNVFIIGVNSLKIKYNIVQNVMQKYIFYTKSLSHNIIKGYKAYAIDMSFYFHLQLLYLFRILASVCFMSSVSCLSVLLWSCTICAFTCTFNIIYTIYSCGHRTSVKYKSM